MSQNVHAHPKVAFPVRKEHALTCVKNAKLCTHEMPQDDIAFYMQDLEFSSGGSHIDTPPGSHTHPVSQDVHSHVIDIQMCDSLRELMSPFKDDE